MCSDDKARDAQLALIEVRNILDHKDTSEDISLQELLSKADVSLEMYVQGLQICSTGSNVIMQRKPSESWINTYNPDVIRVRRANMDIQFILDPYACVMYIASYMLKSEKSMGELLKQVWLLGSVFLNHREVSAQEVVYRILSLPLKQLSRKVVLVNTDLKQERVCILKKPNLLRDMEDDDENIFQTSLIDRYTARPATLNDKCLAEFAANYTTRNGQDVDEESSDTLPKPDEGNEGKQQCIQLNNDLGFMYKRKREAVIRFHKFNFAKLSNKVYRSKLMLYLPWRNENTDILGGYIKFKVRYDDMSDDILVNEQKSSQNPTLLEDAVGQLNEHGPPQHAWDQVAPGTEEQQVSDRAEGVVEETSIEQDLDSLCHQRNIVLRFNS